MKVHLIPPRSSARSSSNFGHRHRRNVDGLLTLSLAATQSILFIVASFSFLLLPWSSSHAELLSQPSLKWSIQLEGSDQLTGRGMKKGNAIVAYKDEKILLTADDGSLHILLTTNSQVKTLAVFSPDKIQDSKTECRSGLAIVDANVQDGHYFEVITAETTAAEVSTNAARSPGGVAKDDYIIYAVYDSSELFDTINSRVFAINLDGTYRWSVEVEGRVAGTPVVGKNGIFVSHNNDNGIGYLSVIRVDPTNSFGSIVATVSSPATQAGTVNNSSPPFSAPSLRQTPSWSREGNFLDDVVVVAESWDQGFSEVQGGLHMLTLKNTDDNDSETSTSSYLLQKISSYSYSAIAPPLVYGDSIFLGSAGGNFAGFTGGRRYSLAGILNGRMETIDPAWMETVQPNPLNSSQPIWSKPVIDQYGDYLLVPGVDKDFYCFQSNNGRELWRNEEGSQILAQPKVFEGNYPVAYVIESLNGRVRQYNLYNGERNWDYSCADISDKLCQDPVEAEFAITPSGNTIYYGDINGRINSLEVASFETETPTTQPSLIPTADPTAKPTLTLSPTKSPFAPISFVAPTAAIDATENPTAKSVVVVELTLAPTENTQKLQDEDKEVEQLHEEDVIHNNDQVSSIIEDQAENQKQKENEKSSNTGLYIGASIAGLCALIIPFVILSLFRETRKRKKRSTEVNDMLVIDDCDSDDMESQSADSVDSGSGERGIEIEFINDDAITPTKGTPTKKKKRKKKKKKSLPDTPQTAQTLESIDEEQLEESVLNVNSDTMVVIGDDGNFEEPSIEAVNLRQRFDSTIDDQEAKQEQTSELAVKEKTDLTHLRSSTSEYANDNESMPPLPSFSSKSSSSLSEPDKSAQWTWSSLLQIGASQSTEKENSNKVTSSPNQNPEKLELKETNRSTSPDLSSQEKSIFTSNDSCSSSSSTAPRTNVDCSFVASTSPSNTVPTPVVYQRETPLITDQDALDIDKAVAKTAPNYKYNMEDNRDDKQADKKWSSEEDLTPDENTMHLSTTKETHEEKKESVKCCSRPQTPKSPVSSSPSALLTLSNAVDSPSSSSNSSNDDSLYTSMTNVSRKKDSKDLSPLSTYVLSDDKDIHRRGRSELTIDTNQDTVKEILSQPDLSKSGNYRSEQNVPDDEKSVVPGIQCISKVPKLNEEETRKYGMSVRTKRESVDFKSSPSPRKESKITPLAQMYDQLAAMGQQKAEEKKHSYKRRNKRADRGDTSTPIPPQEDQAGSDWGSFLSELADAEKQFYTPTANKNQSLLDSNSDSEESDDAEIARINNFLYE